ncbi:hypothetical protein PENTCL1PPCAC_19708, partial [Pristionchus entomophagus]
SEKEPWEVDYEIDLLLLNRGKEKSKKKLLNASFHHDATSRGYYKFLPFADLMDITKGYIDGDKVTVEARIRVEKINGIRKRTVFDFTQPTEGMNNVVLKIGDHRLHVSKDLLAIHSPVFAATFFGNFKEKNENEIELHDIVYEDFVNLLNVIYPSSIEITAFNVIAILKLADRFEIKSVLDRIVTYFVGTKKFTTAKKIQVAEKYRLYQLMDFCIKSLTNVYQIKDFKATSEYGTFSQATKA